MNEKEGAHLKLKIQKQKFSKIDFACSNEKKISDSINLNVKTGSHKS